MEITQIQTPEAVQALADTLVPDNFKSSQFFSVMLFVQGRDLGLEEEEADLWFHVRSLRFTSPDEALGAYAGIPCPASQLLEASSESELLEKEEQMMRNFEDSAWLEENLYPYL